MTEIPYGEPFYKDTVERLQLYYDQDYSSEGSYALDTEEETAEVVTKEQEALERGTLVALVAVLEKKCTCCGHWHWTDSLHGIVMPCTVEAEEVWKEFF